MLYPNSVSWLVFTHRYIISIPLHQNQCANMTYMDWKDFPTTPIVGIYNVTSLHPQFPHCFLKCTSMVACYGRIRTKRFPRCTCEPVLSSLTLAWVPERGWPRDVWAAAMFIPCTKNRARSFRWRWFERQHLRTQNKQWSHPKASSAAQR